MRSPSFSLWRFTRWPFTKTPCRLSRSSTKCSPWSTEMRAWLREMRLSRRTRLFSPCRPIRNGTGSIGTRLRFPDGFVTASAGVRTLASGGWPVAVGGPSGIGISGSGPSSAPAVPRPVGGGRRFRHRRLGQFFRAQDLAVGTVPAHLGPRQDDLKSEMSLYLIAHLLQQVAKELLNLAAAHTNYMGMFLFQAGFVIMLVAIVMHQVQLVHQAARFEKLQGSVHGDA